MTNHPEAALRALDLKISSRIEIDALTGCWNWCGYVTPYGYGSIHTGGKQHRVHRLIHELLVGPIPEGLCIDHLCRNRRCANPSHLEPVTNAENIMRGISPPALHALKTHCIRGHELSRDEVDSNGHRVCQTCKAMLDRQSKEKLRTRTRAPRHDVRGERVSSAKLTQDVVRRIKAETGGSSFVLADKYNVSSSAIRDIRQGRTWRWVQ